MEDYNEVTVTDKAALVAMLESIKFVAQTDRDIDKVIALIERMEETMK